MSPTSFGGHCFSRSKCRATRHSRGRRTPRPPTISPIRCRSKRRGSSILDSRTRGNRPHWGLPKSRSKKLSKIVEATTEELKMVQNVISAFFLVEQPRVLFINDEQGPVMSQEEDERLAREDEANFQMALALSQEEAHRSVVVELLPKRRQASEVEFVISVGGAGESSAVASPTRVPLAEVVKDVDVEGDDSSPILIPDQQSFIQARKEAAYHRDQGLLDVAVGSQGMW